MGHRLYKQNDIPHVFIQTSKTTSKLHCYVVTDSQQKCVSGCRHWTITLIPRCGSVNKRTTLAGELTYCRFISSNMAKAYSHVNLEIVKVKSTSLVGLIERRQPSKIFVHFGVDFTPLTTAKVKPSPVDSLVPNSMLYRHWKTENNQDFFAFELAVIKFGVNEP